KRYQVQPVWRADRPQKGRYREFTQCDADIVGSGSLVNEIELAGMYHEVFTRLNIKGYSLHINDRRILAGLAKVCKLPGQMSLLAVAIDKLDKTSLAEVLTELQNNGLGENQISLVEKFLTINGSNTEILTQWKIFFGDEPGALAGIQSLETILSKTQKCNIQLDGTLARGLDYYTGTIFEVKAPAEVKIGSIGGGGRYDNLTGLFGVTGIAGVGISFGVDRIYDVLLELNAFPDEIADNISVLLMNLGFEAALQSLPILSILRYEKISCDIYPDPVKMDKQVKYAVKKNYSHVIIRGSREIESSTCTIKNLLTSTQEVIKMENLKSYFRIN
ncbi:MAG: ATP phosphoribosyltransferase regulatory subunit, partial [Ferruginibacter sp.]